MLPALSDTLREGLGAFLVVAVMLAFFTRSGRHRFRNATRWGIALSIPSTAAAAALFSTSGNQALWEAVLALGGAACVAWIAWHMWRTSRPSAAQPSRPITFTAICLVTVLMITRGAMEIALLLGTMILQVPALNVIVGAMLGPALAIVLGLLWAWAGLRVRRRLFAQVTAIFLFVLFLQLVVDGVHELTEAEVIPGSEALHWATESFSTEGVYGRYAQYLLIAVPVMWWVVALFLGHGKAPDGGVADVGR